DPGAAAAVARYLGGSGGVAMRIPLPATAEASPDGAPASRGQAAMPGPASTPAGALVLLGDRRPTELERIAGTRIAGTLALELARDEAIRRAGDAAREDRLPSDGPPWVVLVARQVATGGRSDAEDREEMRREVRLLAPGRRLALRGSAESLELRAVIAAPADDPSGLQLAERIGTRLGRTVALSRPFGEPSQRPVSEAEARATLESVEAVAALDPAWSPPVVARADRIAAYRALGALHNIPDGSRLARALLAPILAGRPAAVRERLATLRAVLDNAGPAEAAAALRVHRNTLAYRIRRIEEATGWRLADPTLRLPLSLAVRLVQDAQDKESTGTV
ncbi:MAG TPA: helix-turn-helix domain-containing protein, partial [Candidatus Dormibacteraeota bacterium]|nr:helix-turn-helix domain-containing protein [Candidatus Dormibacteraeota bacterium]